MTHISTSFLLKFINKFEFQLSAICEEFPRARMKIWGGVKYKLTRVLFDFALLFESIITT